MTATPLASPAPALDAVPGAWDDLPVWSAPFGLALLELVRLRPGLRVLDLGCGTGFPLVELAERLGPTAELTGVDPCAASLARAAGKLAARGIAQVRLEEGRAEALPFPEASFDLLVSNNGLNNVQDPAAALAECARVCAPGAQLLLSANLPGTFALFYDFLRALLEERGLAACLPALEVHIRERRPTADQWRERLERAGFLLRRGRESTFTWSFLDGRALLGHSFIRHHFLPAWRALLPEDQAEAFLAFLQGRLDRLALERGGLHLDVPFLCLDARRV